MPFGMEKLEWCGYPIVKKFRRYLYSFDMIHERDRHTHRHTHTLRDGIRAYAALMHSIARQKRGRTAASFAAPLPQIYLKILRLSYLSPELTLTPSTDPTDPNRYRVIAPDPKLNGFSRVLVFVSFNEFYLCNGRAEQLWFITLYPAVCVTCDIIISISRHV